MCGMCGGVFGGLFAEAAGLVFIAHFFGDAFQLLAVLFEVGSPAQGTARDIHYNTTKSDSPCLNGQQYHSMIYISDKEQERIKMKISKLPAFLRRSSLSLLVFQAVGMLILTYGSCMGRYMHPISDHRINPTYQFLNSCFFYFALSVAVPFSGGHLNPAVTIAMHRFAPNSKMGKVIAAQLVGALLGASIAYLFFGVVPYFYWAEVGADSLAYDALGEVFGAFFFVLFWLVITETNYMAGEYFRYMLLSIMLLAARTFTLRKGCLNPAIALAFQLFAAIEKGNFMLFLPYSLTLIVGPILGGMLAVWFFKDFYGPLKEGLAMQRGQLSQINEDI